MTSFVIFIHAIFCILLAIVILMQSGRGGGLTENFASAESIFGAQTNQFMVKTTTVFAVLFFVTCLGLAVLSSKKEQSLMEKAASSSQPAAESAKRQGGQSEQEFPQAPSMPAKEDIKVDAPQEAEQPIQQEIKQEPPQNAPTEATAQ